MKVVIRGFKHRKLIFEQPTELDDSATAKVTERVAADHVNQMIEGRIGMVEIEFCDAPENERFLRIGIEPDGMVIPIALPITSERND